MSVSASQKRCYDQSCKQRQRKKILSRFANLLGSGYQDAKQISPAYKRYFRLYICLRKESAIISDTAILYSPITCDSEGYPLQITNSSFEIIRISESDMIGRGKHLYNELYNIQVILFAAIRESSQKQSPLFCLPCNLEQNLKHLS